MGRTDALVSAPVAGRLVGWNLGPDPVALLAGACSPVHRIATAQPIYDVVTQRSRYLGRATVGEDRDPDAGVRHEGHQRAPPGPAATVRNDPVAAVVSRL